MEVLLCYGEIQLMSEWDLFPVLHGCGCGRRFGEKVAFFGYVRKPGHILKEAFVGSNFQGQPTLD